MFNLPLFFYVIGFKPLMSDRPADDDEDDGRLASRCSKQDFKLGVAFTGCSLN